MLSALEWSCALLGSGLKERGRCSGQSFKNLVEAQSVYHALISACGCEPLVLKCRSKLFKSWDSVPGVETEYWAQLSSEEMSPSGLVLGCLLMSRPGQAAPSKPVLLESFVKSAVSTRTRPADWLVCQCSPLLRSLSHEEVRSTLLPAMNRSLLRNPEVVLGSLAGILFSLTLDLSPYVADLTKPLTVCLCSNEDSNRQEAVQATTALAVKCGDPASIRSIITAIFALLGTEAKLTNQKLSVLDALAGLSGHRVVGSADGHRLSQTVAELLVKVLDSELHEGTLLKAVHVLQVWAAKFHQALPKAMMDAFNKGMSSKTSTAPIRTAYIRCLSSALNSSVAAAQSTPAIPALLKCLDRSSSQPNQASIASEAVASVALLLRLAAEDVTVEAACSALWPLLVDTDKLIIIQDKMLLQYTTHSQIDVVQVPFNRLLSAGNVAPYLAA